MAVRPPVPPPFAPTPKQVEVLEELAAKLPVESLARIRDAASKWVGTIGTLTGLGSILALLGRDDISALPKADERNVAIILGIAFLSALLSVLLGALAAQGTPVRMSDDIMDIANKLELQAKEATEFLSLSRVLAVFAALLLGSSVYYTWFGPPDPGAFARVVTTEGGVLCGPRGIDDGGQLTLNGEVLTGVVSIADVGECP